MPQGTRPALSRNKDPIHVYAQNPICRISRLLHTFRRQPARRTEHATQKHTPGNAKAACTPTVRPHFPPHPPSAGERGGTRCRNRTSPRHCRARTNPVRVDAGRNRLSAVALADIANVSLHAQQNTVCRSGRTRNGTGNSVARRWHCRADLPKMAGHRTAAQPRAAAFAIRPRLGHR